MTGALASSGFRSAVDWATLVGAGVAVLGLVAALGLGTASVQLLLLSIIRRRTIGRSLRHVAGGRRRGGPLASRIRARVRFWRRFDRATRTLLTRRLGAGAPQVVDEFSWLAEVLGSEGREDSPSGGRPVALPLPFAPELQGDDRAGLDSLAHAYRAYASAIRRRWLLRTAAGPLATEEFTCALASAQRLTELARQRLIDDDRRCASPLLTWIDLRVDNLHSPALQEQTRLLAWPIPRQGRGVSTFASLTTSYVPHRIVRPDTPGERTAAGRTTLTVPWVEGERRPEGAHFDGIMSRLHGEPGFRIELDEHSGRQSLHVCISETSFFAFAATQWAERDPQTHGDLAHCARGLSMNLLLVDDAGKVVLVRRNPGISHGNGFAGAASGACELVDRAGMRADLDDSGFPAPLVTALREAREELGLDLSTREARLSALGLIQVKSWRDLYTYVLVATARLAEPAERFRLVPGSTDDVEGTWELGSDAMVVDVKAALSDRSELAALVRWLRSAEEVLPHATGSLLLLLASKLGNEPQLPTKTTPTLEDLESAVVEPLAAGRLRVPRSVTFQPLWDEER